jgi:hypothetical protein
MASYVRVVGRRDQRWHRILPSRGKAMPKFMITFVPTGVTPRPDEEVTAEEYEDRQPFVDFVVWNDEGNKHETVARYRADEIRRIIREG